MYSPFKEWLLRKLEPYREERASELLAWRIFAQKHNASGRRPLCAWEGMDEKGYELDPEEKVNMYEFPYGHDSLDSPLDPDLLEKANEHDEEQRKRMLLEAAKDRLG